MTMRINYTGHHVDVTTALRTFTDGKFERLHRRHEQINRVNITFAIEKLNQIAEANIHVAGTDIHAKAVAEDLYSAIDALIDKLDRQLSKQRGKEIKFDRHANEQFQYEPAEQEG